MSDEEDYMSDKFLAGISNTTTSLIKDRAKKRQIELELKQKDNIKRQKESKKLLSAKVDNERLQEALTKPLPEENRGFKLLAKMGYKRGQTLGKPVTEESASLDTTKNRLTEPIGITIKTDRQGLGREAALKELNERRQQIREQLMRKQMGNETSIEEFRRRTNQKHEEKFILNALRRCQITCENVDLESKLEKPEMSWFWPEKIIQSEETKNQEGVIEQEETCEEEDEFSNQDKLEMLTNYLRTSYLFCYWCGVRYNDEQDLSDNCPGKTKDDH